MASPSRSTVARADYGRGLPGYGRGLPGGAVSITLVKPFVQIATRPEDDVAATEREAVLDFTGLAEDELIWARLDRDPFPDVGATDISGIILCGSPFTASDPDDRSEEHTSELQSRFDLVCRLLLPKKKK